MPENTLPLRKKRNAEIEILRFWAAISVCAFHAHIFSGGLLAVDFFFVLSGALMTRSLVLSPQSGQRTIFSYVYKQIKAIYPELCISILLPLIILICFMLGAYIIQAPNTHILITNEDIIPYVLNTIANSMCFLRMTGLTDPATGFGGPTWYLSSMFIAIILTYPIISCTKNPLVLFCLACLPLAYLIHHAGGMEGDVYYDWYGITYGGNYRAVGGILMGAIVPHVAKLLKDKGIANKHENLLFLLKWASIIGMSVLFIHRYRPLEPYILLFSTISLTLIFVRIDDSRKDGVLSSLCLLLGRLSLSLYLSHSLILRIVLLLALHSSAITMINQYHLYYPCLVFFITISTCFTYAGAQYIRRTLRAHTD